MKSPAQIKWNRKYQDREFDHKKLQPSNWLKSYEGLLKRNAPGKALDIACGDGRNSFYLASLGYAVDAVDISDIAIDWLAQQVNDQALSIQPINGDLEEIHLKEQFYDVIINFNYLQRSLFTSLVKWLKPGGYLFFETMNVDHIEKLNHGINRAFVLEKNELAAVFSELSLLEHKELITHDFKINRGISRLCARKPAS